MLSSRTLTRHDAYVFPNWPSCFPKSVPTFFPHFTCLSFAHCHISRPLWWPPDAADERLRDLIFLSPCLTEPLDREDDPDPLPSSPWDLPLGRGGEERSGEEPHQSFSIISYFTYFPSGGKGCLAHFRFLKSPSVATLLREDKKLTLTFSFFIILSWTCWRFFSPPGGGEPSGERHLCCGE